jgi:hypothetical protein
LAAAPRVPFNVVRVDCGRQRPRGGWYSDSYNKIEPAPALVMTLPARLPWHSATLLFPYRGPTPPAVQFTFDGRQAKVQAAGSTWTVRPR